MRLYPAPGLKIRDPITHAFIPASGVDVPAIGDVPTSLYWARLLRDKDVTTTAPKAAVSSAPAEPAPPATPSPEPAPAKGVAA